MALLRRLTPAAAVPCGLWLVGPWRSSIVPFPDTRSPQHTRNKVSGRRCKPWALCEGTEAAQSQYYGSYSGDRFGGGIGRRIGLDESRQQLVPHSCVSRVALISETHENLRDWATAENWRRATEIHKAAYFTRKENPVQEEVLQRVRAHYASSQHVAHVPVQAALFRLSSRISLESLCENTVLKRLPSIVFGVFDEREERCVVDFANKRLGGGWLSYGMVQEEKMFVERFDYGALCARSLLEMPDPTTEPIASPFSMRHDEAWVLRGAPTFARLNWYGWTPPDGLARTVLLDPAEDRETAPAVVAIDAIKASFPVYTREHLELMLVKAYVGFAAIRHDPDVGGEKRVATGSWGCGAFYNNERVMFVVQSLAAALAGVELTYHVLGDGYRLAEGLGFLEDAMLKKLTVEQTLEALAKRCSTDPQWRSKFDPTRARSRR